jgi:ribose transport system ATP-binding protein
LSFSVSSLRKSFGGVEVLRGVSFDTNQGEIHALLGANGAGKSTLIKCLSGAHRPDAGVIELDGVPYGHLTPQSAAAAGISVIYQNLSLIDSLSITDNIFLGRELSRNGLIRHGEQRRLAQAALDDLLGDDYGLDARALVGDLPMASKQLVEIAKALSRNDIRLLILDEPTAALSEREAARLRGIVQRVAARGVHVLFITHILSDVFEIAHRITVLRDGQVVLDEATASVGNARLTEAITGRADFITRATSGNAAGRVLLEVDNLCGARFSDISFRAHAGEVVGIFGLVGSGRSELFETLFGARRPDGGHVRLDGAPLPMRAPRLAVSRGLALVPGERNRQSVFAELDAASNMLQPAYGQLAGNPLLRNRDREGAAFEDGARAVGLRPLSPHLAANHFSGGNLQKIVVARWAYAYRGVKALLLDEPTQGIDVGARADLYALLRSEAVLKDRTIVFTTADPDEIEQLADRILVLCRGRIVAEFERRELDRSQMLHLAHSNADPGVAAAH